MGGVTRDCSVSRSARAGDLLRSYQSPREIPPPPLLHTLLPRQSAPQPNPGGHGGRLPRDSIQSRPDSACSSSGFWSGNSTVLLRETNRTKRERERESDCEMLSQDQIGASSGDDDSSRGSPPKGAGPQLKKGPWTPSEDAILEAYVKKHGEGNWNAVQKNTTLLRCGKSCRLRWANHLRPNLKKGAFTKEEENLIIKLHYDMGNKWARMAAYLPGRTDNEIKNYWNTRVKKCQRTDAPIHPANICLQASNEDQHESTDFSFSEKLANDLRGNGLNVPQLSDVSNSNTLDQSFASKNYGFMDQVNQVKVLKESESSFPVLNATINGAFFGSHAFSNGNLSASRSTAGPLKIELPSLQDAESDPNNRSTHSRTSAVQTVDFADLCMHSAATLSAKSECMAPRNSGQLEELLPEAHALSSVENQQLSVGSLSSSVGTSCDAMMESSKLDLCEEFWEQDPIFYTLISSDFSVSPLCSASPDEFRHSEISPAQSPVFGSSELIVPQYEQAIFSPHGEGFKPDALFSWNTINPSIFNDTIGMLLENDADTEWQPLSCGTTILPK